MAADLGPAAEEVHAAAQKVLHFWFGELTPEQHFMKDPALDATIRDRFGALRDDVLRTDARDWRGDPETLLAAILLLDQFSRNIHRGTREAFAADPLARALTREMIDRGWDRTLPPDRRAFVYMPLMHAEDPELQRECVRRFEALGMEEQIAYARAHAEVIDRYGRFPHRNATLGRRSTAEEEEYLSRPDAGW